MTTPTLDELTQVAMKAQAGSLTKAGHARAALAVLAAVRAQVPEESYVYIGRTSPWDAGFNKCRDDMLARLDSMTGDGNAES